MLAVGGFGGRGHPSSSPPPRPSLSSMLCLRCILQGSPYRHTSPVERGNPLLRLVLCLSLTLLTPSFLYHQSFFLQLSFCVPGVVRTTPSSLLLLSQERETGGAEARRVEANRGGGERGEPRNEPSRRKHKLNPTRDSSGPP